ncbi:hypothetical protein DSO57_1020521 [Entomophthora muscae]|uniref:Uncharacterized protein n=1 Tax=Entomophthora muscae TaxID=34485 RepID=A0ACC2S5N5_9FUNG|nr:hypothetical protein DSO57_1020521 [Entomophthora muscae]
MTKLTHSTNSESSLQNESLPHSTLPLHLGDAMSLTETSISIPGNFSPLERILLSANGSLQRVLSAYFNKPIKIVIVKNVLRGVSGHVPATYDREVHIFCEAKMVCKATSVIEVSEPRFIKMLEDDSVGVGQLFRYISVLPEFKLLEFGRTKGCTAIYRIYTLATPGITCTIQEDFAPNFLDQV